MESDTEMESDTSDENSEKFDENDWYKARLHSKFCILALVYIGHLFITNSEHPPRKMDIWPSIERVRWENPRFLEKSGLGQVDWNKIKDVLKNMWRKYKNEENHDLYESFLEQASALYTSFERT